MSQTRTKKPASRFFHDCSNPEAKIRVAVGGTDVGTRVIVSMDPDPESKNVWLDASEALRLAERLGAMAKTVRKLKELDR